MKHVSQKNSASLSFGVLCLCMMVPNFIQYQVSSLGPAVMKQYAMSLSQLSMLFTAPMIPAVFLSLTAGLLIDKFGAKAIIGAGMVITTIGAVGRIVGKNFPVMLVTTLLTGFSITFINAGSGKIIGNLFSPQKVPEKMSILMAASSLAMSISNLTSAYFPSVTAAFVSAAVFSCIATVLWFVLEKDYAAEQQSCQRADMVMCVKVVFKNGDVWFVAFASFFFMASNVVIGSFLPTALSFKGISSTTAGTIAALYTIGSLIGCFFVSFCIQKVHSQRIVLIAFAAISAVGMALSLLICNVVFMAIIIFVTGVFMGGVIPTLLALPVQFAAIGPKYAGTAGGVVGTIQLLGAVVVPNYILTPIAGNNFIVLFLLSGLCMLISGMFSALIKGVR